MIGAFRHFLNTWAARGFFLMLVGVFIVWGVGSDVIRMIAEDPAVATVGSRRIELPEATEAYRRQLAQVTRSLGTNITPTPEIRRAVAAQALQGLIVQAAMDNAANEMGLVVPDESLRQAVYDMPAFRGPDGAFSRDAFLNILRENNYSEPRFLALMRADIAQRQLSGAVRAGTASPEVLTRAVYAFQHETRTAEAASFPFVTAPPPAPPGEAQLARWYENHKDLYATAEYRTITAAVLSAETVARDVQITDADLRAAWETGKAAFQKPERRSVEVILTQSQDQAVALAAVWGSGTDWAEMQKKATAEGAAPVALDDATRDEFPAPELGEAVFQAAADTVPAPVHSALGWHVLKVVKITPGGAQSFEQASETLRAQLQAEKSADLIDARANKLDDLLAGGAKLDDLPADLGVTTLRATLDATGADAQGQKVALPVDDALRAAVLAEAFRMKQGEPPHLIEAPRTQPNAPQAYYAVAVEGITPPAPRPMAEVAEQVRADWTKDAVRHAREEQAAGLLAAVKGGKSMAEAAAAAGVAVTALPAAGRASATAGVPVQLIEPLFALKVGEPTMTETEDGFIVAVLSAVVRADPDADPIGMGQIREAMSRSLADDLQASLAFALRDRAAPRINRAAADSIAQPE